MKSYRTLNIILICTCLIVDIGAYVIYSLNRSKNAEKLSELARDVYYPQVNKLKPIDPPISPNVSHSKFLELKWQQKESRALKNGDHSHPYSNLISIVGAGYGEILCYSCKKGPNDPVPNTIYYYISLWGWKLKSTTSPVPVIDSVIFHVEKGQAYIRKNVVETKIIDGDKISKVEVKDIPVKFKYSHKSHMLKIPIDKHTVERLKPIFTTFNIVLVLYGLFNVLIFIQLIMSLLGGSSFGISVWWKSILALAWFPFFIIWIILRLIKLLQGDSNTPIWNANEFAFTTYNIVRLRILAYSFTIIPIFFLLLNWLMRFIFSSYFTGEVVVNTAHLYPWWITMHVGIAFFLILNVFMQGKALKDEQDLTV